MDGTSILDILFGPGPILAVQQFFGPGWEWFFGAVTHIAGPAGLAIVVALALWLSGRPLAYRLIGILLLSAGIAVLLWNAIGLDRPDDPRIVIRADPPVSSFPSGHVMQATVIWGLLTVVGIVPAAVTVLIVALEALSRIYLGVHYPGDVLGGALIGLSLLFVYCRILLPWAAPWLLRQSFTVHALLGLVAVIATLAAVPVVADTSDRLVLGSIGAVIGGAVAVLVESHYVRFCPVPVPLGSQALKLLIGFGGTAVILLPLVILPSLGGVVFAADVALATAWVLLGAPAAFTWLGLAERADECPTAEGRGDR